MTFLIDLLLGNLPAILGGVAALFGVGYIYRKGRVHARAKADRELQDALDDTKAVAARARHAGDRAGDSDLRADDGHKRID